jgi:GNAT superfamily N-acetyltransferase
LGEKNKLSGNKIIENYQKDEHLVNEYHNFISKVFPNISFKEWHQKGFWTENYIPFSILNSGNIISNVCAALLTVSINNNKYSAIQLSAVGTLPEYRNQNLSRRLMNYVLDKYKSRIDFFFLFGNETVLDFYPKFGFRSVDEKRFFLESAFVKTEYSARRLNIKVEDDYKLLQDLINQRDIISNNFGAENYGFITMWHILNFYSNNLFYLDDENIIIIKTENNGVLNIWDVIYKEPFDFLSAVNRVIESDSIHSINYYFPPDQLKYEYNNTASEKSGLFIKSDIEIGNELPKFPVTAHT